VARRSAAHPRALTTDLEVIARLAVAIVLNTFALSIWNIGTRALLAVLRDIGGAMRNRRAFVTGALGLVVGLVFVAAATVLILPTVADVKVDFVPIQIFTLLAALAIEHLVGSDLRIVIARLSGTPRSS
jgi:hypothetical protein